MDNTWLQCVMPKPKWDILNARRQKLNVKWSELLPPAVERYLGELETGKIKVEIIRKAKPEKATPTVDKGTKKETKASSATKKAPKRLGVGTSAGRNSDTTIPATPTIKKQADKSKGASKTMKDGKASLKKVEPTIPFVPGDPAEEAAELADIK